ncbi:MAG TPA: signal peptide peptidase SppA, partial [Desulfobacteraceae bacterium]|nr:signal peptide peptidase SppA [Desulfobacteraceae bacterium]
AKARNMEEDVMAKLADGRIYTGQKALKLKLVDRLGNLGDAVKWAAELGSIDGEPMPVYPPQDRMSILMHMADAFKDINLSATLSENLRYISTPR